MNKMPSSGPHILAFTAVPVLAYLHGRLWSCQAIESKKIILKQDHAAQSIHIT